VSNQLFGKIAFVGLGLIGSSLALRIKQDGIAGETHGFSRRAETRQRIQELGLVDQVFDDLKACVEDADLVLVCTPVGTYQDLAHQLAPHLKDGAIVSDVGSVKKSVINAFKPTLPSTVHLVPGHPIAGTEHSGPDAGFPELFEDRWCILTPEEVCDQDAVDKVTRLWEACGSMVEIMDADHHDRVLAITSHLPHIIAYTIVGTATGLEESTQEEVIKYSASGFRDFTRIAASDPVMWRDIFLHNREAVLEMLQRYSEDLTALQRAIRHGQGDVLEEHFTRTRAIRRSIIDAKQAGQFSPTEASNENQPDWLSIY
jgi:cyclohexadieny/prephenate dehydrogenase